MKKLNEIKLSYMDKTFTLEDFYNYINNIKPKDINKIGGLNYAKTAYNQATKNLIQYLENIDNEDLEDNFTVSCNPDFYYINDEFHIDRFLEYFCYNHNSRIPALLAYIDFFKLKEIDVSSFEDFIFAMGEDQMQQSTINFFNKHFNL